MKQPTFSADHVPTTAGTASAAPARRWFQDKKAGWYAVLADPQMPMASTGLDQAHNAIEWKLFAMKEFHHPGESQREFLTGLAHLYNLIPYQRRAKHAGQCGVEVEGGRVPTQDWSSISKSSPREVFDERLKRSTTKSGGMWQYLRQLQKAEGGWRDMHAAQARRPG